VSEGRQPWSRRRWAVYWLFIVAVVVAWGTLSAALDSENEVLAAAVVFATLGVAAIVFVAWVIRLLRT